MPPGGLAIENSCPGLRSEGCLEASTLRPDARLLLLLLAVLLLRKAALPQPIFLKPSMVQLLRVAANRRLRRVAAVVAFSSAGARGALSTIVKAKA